VQVSVVVAVAQLAEALCYKPEGHDFDSLISKPESNCRTVAMLFFKSKSNYFWPSRLLFAFKFNCVAYIILVSRSQHEIVFSGNVFAIICDKTGRSILSDAIFTVLY
jgi:hypothetical protein